MLQHAFAWQVPSDVRFRGEKYYNQDAVTIVRGNKTAVEATVEGTQQYQVLIRRRGKRLVAWCTCPYCDDNLSVCKHIWATLLAADKSGHLAAIPPGRARLSVDVRRRIGASSFLPAAQENVRAI